MWPPRAESPGIVITVGSVWSENAAGIDEHLAKFICKRGGEKGYMIWHLRMMKNIKREKKPELWEAFTMNNRTPHDLSNCFRGETIALCVDMYA